MGLFQRIGEAFSGKRSITTLDDYATVLNEFVFNGVPYAASGSLGIQQTLTSDPVERIPNTLEGFANHAYSSNGIVFACMAVRQLVFSAIRFQFQQIRAGRPQMLFGTPDLGVLENPWAGGTTQDMLSRMIQDADLAGNSYWTLFDGEMIRLRPDWVEIVLAPRRHRGGLLGYRRVGYLYTEGGPQSNNDAVPLLLDEVVHFAPQPDPLGTYRGMSWLTPVLREVQNDGLMNQHKRQFFVNGATPNMVVKGITAATKTQFDEIVDMMEDRHKGIANAYKTLYLTAGADATVVGKDLQQLDFKATQGAGETRIAAAAGVHPVIVGLSEGLAGSSLNAGNFSAARRRFADGTMHPLWQNASGSVQQIITPPPGSRLWYDARDIPFLREDAKDEAEIIQTRMMAIESGVRGGFKPESTVAAITTGDLTLLEHGGLYSVQLQPPGTAAPEGEDPQRYAVTVRNETQAKALIRDGWTPTPIAAAPPDAPVMRWTSTRLDRGGELPRKEPSMATDETRELLASTEYEGVFNAVMSGTEPGLLTEAQRALLVRARELTNTAAPGLPMPSRHDPTRSDEE